MSKSDEASWGFKASILVALVLQNVGVVTMTRYSKGVLHEQYLSSSVVLHIESTKLIFATLMVFLEIEDSHLNGSDMSIVSKVFTLLSKSLVVAIPALCYFVMNVVYYTVLRNISASVFGVLQQTKILAAALFSVLLLRKKLSCAKWRAVMLIVLGATLVEHHTLETEDKNEGNPVLGTAAMLLNICMSGFAGVYWEMILKNKTAVTTTEEKLSVWDRNIQLATWSILFSFFFLAKDYPTILAHGLWDGWSKWTVGIWILSATGGLLNAVVIKYTDVIIKGFATGTSLIGISFIGWVGLGDTLDLIFLIGIGVTIIAVFNYNDPSGDAPREVVVHEDDVEIGKILKESLSTAGDLEMSPANDEQEDLIKRV